MAGKKVLLVDADEEMAKIRADLLANYGFDVTYCSIKDAEAKAARSKYDRIFLTMRNCDSLERYILEQARRQQPEAKIIVYSTVYGFQIAKDQMKLTDAIPLEMVMKNAEIANALM